MLVAFAAAANHCSFYAGSTPLESYKDELEAYDTSKGTIRFQPDNPLPATLVRKLVRAQIAAKSGPSDSRRQRRRSVPPRNRAPRR